MLDKAQVEEYLEAIGFADYSIDDKTFVVVLGQALRHGLVSLNTDTPLYDSLVEVIEPQWEAFQRFKEESDTPLDL